VREFLDQFTARSPGSFIEQRSTGFVWHFGRTDRIEGRAQAQTLYALLQDAAGAMGFSVTLGPWQIDIGPAGLSKERTIRKLLEKDARSRRLIVFEGFSPRTTVRNALRASDVLVTVGAAHAPGDPTLLDMRAVRDLMSTVVGWLPPARRRTPALATRIRNAAAAIAGAANPASPSQIPIRIE
jgi:trehalose 6-phosphate synthase/phosphatase